MLCVYSCKYSYQPLLVLKNKTCLFLTCAFSLRKKRGRGRPPLPKTVRARLNMIKAQGSAVQKMVRRPSLCCFDFGFTSKILLSLWMFAMCRVWIPSTTANVQLPKLPRGGCPHQSDHSTLPPCLQGPSPSSLLQYFVVLRASRESPRSMSTGLRYPVTLHLYS